jgi:chitinase
MENMGSLRNLRKFVLLSALLVFSMASPAYSIDVTLAWETNTEPDLAGYTIYYDADSGHPYSGVGALEGGSPVIMPLDQDEDPDPEVVQFTLRDLPSGDYYFAVTASNTEGDQSDYSNEVSTAAFQVIPSDSVQTTGGGGGCFIYHLMIETESP